MQEYIEDFKSTESIDITISFINGFSEIIYYSIEDGLIE